MIKLDFYDFTIQNTYNSVLDTGSEIICIEASSEIELCEKKLEILKIAKEILIERLTNEVSQTETEIVSDLCNLSKTSKKKFNPDLWQPVITEHPPVSKGYRKHERHEGFIQYQPMSERYLVPGLLPRKQNLEGQSGPILSKKPLSF